MNCNQLHHGDNLLVLRELIADASIDLVYLDPPFNSNAVYEVNHRRTRSRAQTAKTAFDDTWRWDDDATREFEEVIANDSGVRGIADALLAFRTLIGAGPLLAYLTRMAPRLVELQRVLKPTGSVYLHCDHAACHYLKVLMDAVFGVENFLNNIVWLYGLGGSSPRYWPRKHDDILWYSRESGRQYFTPAMVPATSNRMKGQLKKAPDYWNIPTINNMARERMGYPTQKPEALLERIIESSSRSGDVVLDPFCGGGTTLAVAERLGRRWIGIDSAATAIELTAERLASQIGRDVKIVEHGAAAGQSAA